MALSLIGVSITRSPAKPLQQTFAGLERPAVHADVFPKQHDSRVSLHLLEHRLLDGFEKSDLCPVRRAAIRSGPFVLAMTISAPFSKRSQLRPSWFSLAPISLPFSRGLSAIRRFSIIPGRMLRRLRIAEMNGRVPTAGAFCQTRIPEPSKPLRRPISAASLPQSPLPLRADLVTIVAGVQ